MSKRSQTKIDFTQSEIEIILKYFKNGICSFDFEMTGLSPLFDHIIEIAAVKIDNSGKISIYHQLVNPLVTLPERSKKFHGLENEDLRAMPTLKAPIREFTEFYSNLPLCAHNAMFDIGFLVRSLHQFNFPLSLSDVFDTVKFSRKIYANTTGPKNHKLSTLADYFNLSFTHHYALEDAYISLKIMAALLKELEKKEAPNLKDYSFLYKLKAFDKNKEIFLPKKLSGIKEYIQDQKLIEINYKGGSNPNTYRTIKPLSLLNLPQGLILYALCIATDANKFYKVKKINSFKESKKE